MLPLLNITSIKSRTGDCRSANQEMAGGAGPVDTVALPARFLSKIMRSEGGCWLWQASCYAGGYGQFAWRGGRVRAHRLAWEFAHGPLWPHQHVLHKCDTPRCVNPAHLFLGDQDANMKDASAKGRLRRPHPKKRTVPDAVVRAIVEAPAQRGLVSGFARRFGISKTYVSMLRRGVRVRVAL